MQNGGTRCLAGGSRILTTTLLSLDERPFYGEWVVTDVGHRQVVATTLGPGVTVGTAVER